MIVGDIGGTKTQLAVAKLTKNGPTLEHVKRYVNNEHDCFDGILSSYLMEHRIEQPSSLVLSVAGPVKNNQCMITNLPWEIHANQLSNEFKISNVNLLNDLAATAHAIPHLPDSDFAWLQRPEQDITITDSSNESISVISAGSGLGEASLFYSEEKQEYFVVPGEGGHKNFAPSSDIEVDLLTYYLKQQTHVSVEALVSGMGLQRIYHFLEEQPDWQDHVPSLSDADNDKILNELITQLAYELPDSIYSCTVEIFAQMLMSEAGNLALQTYSNGGVVIAGGIPPAILKFIDNQEAMAAFRNKGRFKHWLSTLPVRVCLNTSAPLLGTWAFGQQKEK